MFNISFVSCNSDDAGKYIEKFYEISSGSIREPVNKFKIKYSPQLSNGAMSNASDKSDLLADYENLKQATTSAMSSPVSDHHRPAAASLGENYMTENRKLAIKFLNLRQEYFEKASEAYRRGWKHVAYYYSTMAHQQSDTIKSLNKDASMEIFLKNNPDLRSSNTLDLHGLYVREALEILKNMINYKKQGKSHI